MANGKPGRPRIHFTDDQRKEVRKIYRLKTRNITVDHDIVDRLNKHADELTEGFGFRPTLSQTLRHLIKVCGP